MVTEYRRRRGERGNSLSSFILGGVFLCVLGVIVWGIRDKERERADTRRLLELRIEHGDVSNDLYRLPDDHPDRPRLRIRLREVAAEYDGILSRHPTWTHKPLDTRANTYDLTR